MNIQVLGCSGGVVADARTTSFLLGDDTLIDAGTGVFGLSLQAQQKIAQIFITHAHFDHIAGLPFLIENVTRYRQQHHLPPIRLYASQATLHDLQTHVFNDRVWPNFTVLPSVQRPTIQMLALEVGAHMALNSSVSIEAVSAVHSVPAQGYAVHHHNHTWLYTGDTTHNPLLWDYINQLPQHGKQLRWLVTEVTFSNADQDFADLSRHCTVNGLAHDLGSYLKQGGFELHVMHLKPHARDAVLQELEILHHAANNADCTVHVVQAGQVFSNCAEAAVRHAA